MPLLNVFIEFLIVSVAQGAFGPRRPSLAEQAAFLNMKIDCDMGNGEASICLGCFEKLACDSQSLLLSVKGFTALSLKVAISCINVQQNLWEREERVKAGGVEA